MSFFGRLYSSTSLSGRIYYSTGLVAPWTPDQLFAQNEVGAWYDPSDLTTLFQDTGGTTPVTAAGQRVALMRDKSGRGNHATQATLAQQPLYAVEPATGRRNLLTYSEDVSNAIWTTFQAVKVDADTFRADSGGGTGFVFIGQNITTAGAVSHVVSAEFKYTNNRWVWLQPSALGSLSLQAWFDIQNGVVGTKTGDVTSHAIESVGDGWFRCSMVVVGDAVDTSGQLRVSLSGSDNNMSNAPRDGVASVRVRNIQFEVGSARTAYQRVVTAQDVSEAGVAARHYLFFDGIDDGMLTGTITPGADKVAVFAGVRKLSDAARGTIAELTASAAANNGAFHLTSPNAASTTFAFESKGTSLTDAVASSIAAPATRVLAGLGDIAGDTATLRVNGVQADQDTGDQGTGNYAAAVLYLGRRGGASLPLSGHLYGAIVRFSAANLGAAQIAATERWMAGKTGVVL